MFRSWHSKCRTKIPDLYKNSIHIILFMICGHILIHVIHCTSWLMVLFRYVNMWNSSLTLRALRAGGKLLHWLTRQPRWTQQWEDSSNGWFSDTRPRGSTSCIIRYREYWGDIGHCGWFEWQSRNPTAVTYATNDPQCRNVVAVLAVWSL